MLVSPMLLWYIVEGFSTPSNPYRCFASNGTCRALGLILLNRGVPWYRHPSERLFVRNDFDGPAEGMRMKWSPWGFQWCLFVDQWKTVSSPHYQIKVRKIPRVWRSLHTRRSSRHDTNKPFDLVDCTVAYRLRLPILRALKPAIFCKFSTWKDSGSVP